MNDQSRSSPILAVAALGASVIAAALALLSDSLLVILVGGIALAVGAFSQAGSISIVAIVAAAAALVLEVVTRIWVFP